jgi:type III secretion protein R
MLDGNNPSNLIIFLAILSLIPIIFILTTSFVKIAMVLILTRESLGVQSIPPNIVIYGLSLILSFYIMGPVYNNSIQSLNNSITSNSNSEITTRELFTDLNSSASSVKQFLVKNSNPNEREFFYQSLRKFWSQDMLENVQKDDFIIIIPAFMITELTQAFKIGFLIYLPSVIIDIIVSNVLMAMGMMMMSPTTISLPIKLLLFIALDGWARLTHALLLTYH